MISEGIHHKARVNNPSPNDGDDKQKSQALKGDEPPTDRTFTETPDRRLARLSITNPSPRIMGLLGVEGKQESHRKEGIVESRSLNDSEINGLQQHLNSNMLLQKKIRYGEFKTFLVDRTALLSTFLQKMQQSDYQVQGCYLSGSSINTILSGAEKKSDLDFTATISNLPKNSNESVRTGLRQLMSESIHEVTGNQVSMGEAVQLFGLVNFENRRSNSQVYIFGLGNDTDLVISSQTPNYALAHQARAIDVLPLLRNSSSDGQSASPISTLEYMEDSHHVENAIENKIIHPNNDDFIHWSHIIPVAKSIGKGFTFQSPKVATKFYNSTLSAMQSATSKFSADGVSFLLNKKFKNVKADALLGIALDLPSRVSRLQKDAKKSINTFCGLLCGVLLHKQKSFDCTTDDKKQMAQLVSYLASQKNEDFLNASRDLNSLLTLNHLISQPDQVIQEDVEGKANRFHIDTLVAGLNVGLTFESSHLQQAPRLKPETPQDNRGDRDYASLLLSGWNDECINHVYELAQSLEFTAVTDYIDSAKKTITDRSSSTAFIAQNTDLLPSVFEAVVLSEPKTSKDSGIIESSISGKRFFIGNKSYELIQPSQANISEDGLHDGELKIKWRDQEATLSHLQRSENGAQGNLLISVKQSGMLGNVSTQVSVDQNGEIKMDSKSTDALNLGPLTYTGELKGVYSYKGKLLRLQPVGTDAEIKVNIAGKLSVSIKGDFLSTGQLSVKSIDDKPIEVDSCYVKWDKLADIDECWFDVKKVLDQQSGLQMDAKHKLVTKKVMLEDDISSNTSSGKNKGFKKGKRKGHKTNEYKWENNLIAMQGDLSIKGNKDQRLEYSRLSEFSGEVIVLSDKRENGFISYQIGQESSQSVITSVAIESDENMLLEANDLEQVKVEAESAEKPSSQDVDTLIIKTAVDHLSRENIKNYHFYQNESSGNAELHLTDKRFDVSYSGGRLEAIALRVALPFERSSGTSVAVAAERANYDIGERQYITTGSAENKAIRKKVYKNKKKLAQAVRSNNVDQLMVVKQHKLKNLTFNRGVPQFTWPMDDMVGLSVSPDGRREVTLPFRKNGDQHNLNYLLRYEGELGEKIQLGRNVSTVTLLKHRPMDAPSLDQKLHPPAYSIDNSVNSIPFVQLKQYLAVSHPHAITTSTERPIVERLDIENNQLSVSWKQRGELVLRPIDSTNHSRLVTRNRDGGLSYLNLKTQARMYPEILFRQKHEAIEDHSFIESRRANDLYSDTLELKTDMDITFAEGDSDIQARFKSSEKFYMVEGMLPESQEREPFKVRAYRPLIAEDFVPFMISVQEGNQKKALEIKPFSALVDGLEGFDTQQLKLIELAEAAMRGAIFYRRVMLDAITEAKELINVNTSKIQLPKGLW